MALAALWAVLARAVLARAVLGGAVLGGAVLGGAVLGGAVLGGAALAGKGLAGAERTDAGLPAAKAPSQPTAQPSPQPTAQPTVRRAIEIETVDATLRPMASAQRSPPGLDALSIEPAGGGRPGATLRAGDTQVALADVIFLRIPGPTIEEAPALLLLRTGGELRGKVVGGDADSIAWWSESLGTDPLGKATLDIALDAVQGLIVLPAGRGEPAAPAAPVDPADPAGPPDPAKADKATKATKPARPAEPAEPAGAGGGAGPARAPATREERDREEALAASLRKQILSRQVDADEVVLSEGGRVRGVLAAVGPDGIRIGAESLGDVAISFARIRAIHLAELEPAEPAPAGPGRAAAPGAVAVRVSLRDGGDLPCDLLRLGGGKLVVAHAALGEREIPIPEVLEVAFLDGRARFLSDMEPVSVKEQVGDLAIKKPYQRDASVEGTPMRMRGRTYRKGLGVHSWSLLEYALDGEFSRFRASIGLDDTAVPGPEVPDPDTVGIVVFRIRLDGKTLLEKTMAWRDDPLPVDLVVRGGKRLALEVTYADEGTWEDPTLGRANWGRALLVR